MMINEALMCGSPVVCFDVGIGPDLVNNSTGYLAQNFSYEDLAKGIYKVLFESDIEKLKNQSLIQWYFSIYNRIMEMNQIVLKLFSLRNINLWDLVKKILLN